ncbi:hypothetical protein N6H14_13925 [Paenibacillus sp. CC-CFT747]|nr:hypothetical protein N6H14_13925 [Paenibacillus sp. CC-CFT747]
MRRPLDGSPSLLIHKGRSILRKGSKTSWSRKKTRIFRGLVEFGEIQLEERRKIRRDEGWLRQKLRECGFGDVRQVAYAEWRPGQGPHVLRK